MYLIMEELDGVNDSLNICLWIATAPEPIVVWGWENAPLLNEIRDT